MPLELGIGDEETDGGEETLADILGHDGDATWNEFVGFHISFEGALDAVAHGAFVRSAVWGWNGVDETLSDLVILLAPTQGDIEMPLIVVAIEEAEIVLNFFGGGIFDHVCEEIGETAGEAEDFVCFMDAIVVGDFETVEQVGFDFESFADEVGIELNIWENFGVGSEEDRGSREAAIADASDFRLGMTLAVALLEDAAIAFDVDFEVDAEGVDDARPDAV